MEIYSNEIVKKFKRLLKDIGVYSVWLKERKKYLATEYRKITNDNIFRPVKSFPNNVGEIINLSFIWSDTNNRMMWIELFRKTHYKSIDNCLSEQITDDLKLIVSKIKRKR